MVETIVHSYPTSIDAQPKNARKQRKRLHMKCADWWIRKETVLAARLPARTMQPAKDFQSLASLAGRGRAHVDVPAPLHPVARKLQLSAHTARQQSLDTLDPDAKRNNQAGARRILNLVAVRRCWQS